MCGRCVARSPGCSQPAHARRPRRACAAAADRLRELAGKGLRRRKGFTDALRPGVGRLTGPRCAGPSGRVSGSRPSPGAYVYGCHGVRNGGRARLAAGGARRGRRGRARRHRTADTLGFSRRAPRLDPATWEGDGPTRRRQKYVWDTNRGGIRKFLKSFFFCIFGRLRLCQRVKQLIYVVTINRFKYY